MMTDCLFDDDPEEETIDPALQWSRKLVVAEKVETPEDLNEIEEAFRKTDRCPVLFEEDDGNGGPSYLGNPKDFAKAMNLPAGKLPTLAEAEAFMFAQWEKDNGR